MSSLLYLERLGSADLALVSAHAGASVEELRERPGALDAALERPELFEALFGRREADPFLAASPFLAFSVLLARAVRELGETPFVREWVGPRQRVPVFDAPALREFAADPLRRMFLADVLSSYTHVASGSVWRKTRRGWKPWHFSELDPVRMAQLLEILPERDRLAVHRRLGDLALFLTGVFPDHTASRLLNPVKVERLAQALGRETGGPMPNDAVELLERIGRRAYEAAGRATRGAGMGPVLTEMAERFRWARRVLNYVTDRYLFPVRESWFGAP